MAWNRSFGRVPPPPSITGSETEAASAVVLSCHTVGVHQLVGLALLDQGHRNALGHVHLQGGGRAAPSR